MVPRNMRQEALSRAYVRAVAALAGATVTDIGQDFGVDVNLRGVWDVSRQYMESGVQLDLQVKSTTRAHIRDAEVLYDLEVRAHAFLRFDPVRVPRVLVVHVLPEDETRWLGQTHEELLIRRCAYWISLFRAAPPSTTTTTRVAIPLANTLLLAPPPQE